MESNTNSKPAKAKKTASKDQTAIAKQLAQKFYMEGIQQKDIASRVGVSPQTINKWVKDGKWEELRAANTITRREIVNKMLQQINEKLTAGEWTPDELAKATAAIDKLDKQTNVVTVIEVFSAYNSWLVSRMQIDPELTPETVKLMNRYQDIFISEQLSSSKVQFLQ